MSGLKELRQRIESVESTRKITRAMRMVAASKCAKAQAAANAARPYARYAASAAAKLASSRTTGATSLANMLLGGNQETAHLLVVATAERGLCGGFNSQLARLARLEAQKLREAGKEVLFLCLGKKGHDALKREAGEGMAGFLPLARDPEFSIAAQAQEEILTLLREGKISGCTLIYAEFVSIISQNPVAVSLVPPQPQEAESQPAAPYEFEPESGALLEALLARNLGAQLWRALNENAAGEQGARMAAMDNATRNADEMIDALSIRYNRTRQAVITSELVEIISGAEAL